MNLDHASHKKFAETKGLKGFSTLQTKIESRAVLPNRKHSL